jgi:Ca2+-transporting ATPase
LIGAVATSLLLQLLLLYTPVAAIFGVYGIEMEGWGSVLAAVAVVLLANYGLSIAADRLF